MESAGTLRVLYMDWKLWIRSLKALSYWTQFSCIAFAGIYAIILLVLRRLNMMHVNVDHVLNCLKHTSSIDSADKETVPVPRDC